MPSSARGGRLNAAVANAPLIQSAASIVQLHLSDLRHGSSRRWLDEDPRSLRPSGWSPPRWRTHAPRHSSALVRTPSLGVPWSRRKGGFVPCSSQEHQGPVRNHATLARPRIAHGCRTPARTRFTTWARPGTWILCLGRTRRRRSSCAAHDVSSFSPFFPETATVTD
jgi:hypothetical protein